MKAFPFVQRCVIACENKSADVLPGLGVYSRCWRNWLSSALNATGVNFTSPESTATRCMFATPPCLDQAASEILGAADIRARLDVQAGDATKRVWVNRQHVAYVEDYVSSEPMVAWG
jgi:hypothetical protein